ncbi:NAD-dependent epimerase/dehydratase family protein [Sinomicrobium weinanense]|uniref:NAD-dependent epimerase/dehydratase family protein n=1 Tax=Sinomicrobium weinanense TaxID=2842200 RepID=A0A926Q2S3_9FLAO|nr:NAD-dependent epimerase/dehydratase family protein [Sinomicrobium weinanense]MBC9796823.1 NAD-dependent epimerase/dehydratase family protein [Sinomicrobium weinanense]MBU3123673.1 NAD-dependent epimerase/dehydratase family protein [Sinomicrobium weinanense]
MTPKILIIGACGQIGSELTLALREIHGDNQVIASDIREGHEELMQSGPFEILDVTDQAAIASCVRKHKITDVYLMAAMLSATAEKYPDKGWDLNMNSLFHILNLARDKQIAKIFWPSSIAVFGPSTPKQNTPQQTVMEPSTVYGISKLAGERWCEYYFRNYGVDVRSIRYPGLISWKTKPGGGTTDYAIDIYHKALENGTYECFLSGETTLPMMYMDDAITATINIMKADPQLIKMRSSYNLAGISFNPEEMASSIKKHLPDFTISYAPDFRQKIADTWPQSIDDSRARKDWGWEARYDLDTITEKMLSNLQSLV